MLNKLAEELKAERIKSELTLQQIANKTRIDLKFLEAIEEGNFAFLPELYVRAFIKEYSKIIGLDDELVLKKFEAAKKGKAYDEKGDETVDSKKNKQQETTNPDQEQNQPLISYEYKEPGGTKNENVSSVARKKRLITGGSVIAVLAIFLIIYFSFLKGGSEIIVPEKPYEQVRKENKERYTEETPKPKKENLISTASQDSLLLNIETTDTSWVKILLDDSVVEEFTLFPHSTKDIKARENYKLIVGNAGVVHLKLDNKPLNFTGKDHEVKYISIDSTGLRYLRNPPNFK